MVIIFLNNFRYKLTNKVIPYNKENQKRLVSTFKPTVFQKNFLCD